MSTTASEAIYSTQDSPRFSVGVIASDQSLRSRLVRVLETADIEVDVNASDPGGLVGDPQAPDLLVVFQRGDAATLVESINEARAALPHTALVVVWPAADEVNARRALRAGAVGLVSEAELETTLALTVRAVGSGLTCVPGRLRGRLDSESLSMREKQVLGMLVRGFTNAEIASRLYLAESTVKSHLSSAYSKLGVRSRQDAATMILDPGRGLGPGILAITPA